MELLSNSGPELREPSVQCGHAMAVSCDLYDQTPQARPPVAGRGVASLSITVGSLSASPPASAAAVARPTSRPFASNRYSSALAYPDKRGQE
jgi:hypothetical protein